MNSVEYKYEVGEKIFWLQSVPSKNIICHECGQRVYGAFTLKKIAGEVCGLDISIKGDEVTIWYNIKEDMKNSLPFHVPEHEILGRLEE